MSKNPRQLAHLVPRSTYGPNVSKERAPSGRDNRENGGARSSGVGSVQTTPGSSRPTVKNIRNLQVKVGEDDFIHVRAHKSFQDEVSLWGVQEGKKLECSIEHFQ